MLVNDENWGHFRSVVSDADFLVCVSMGLIPAQTECSALKIRASL